MHTFVGPIASAQSLRCRNDLASLLGFESGARVSIKYGGRIR
ncbi:MAG: hypothetical protein ABI143_06775 [Caldimonas sp.]